MELEKASYPEALKMLAQAGTTSRFSGEGAHSGGNCGRDGEGEPRQRGGVGVQKWFTDQMRNTDAGKAIGRSYFVERGFRDDVLNTFLIGYSPDSLGRPGHGRRKKRVIPPRSWWRPACASSARTGRFGISSKGA